MTPLHLPDPIDHPFDFRMWEFKSSIGSLYIFNDGKKDLAPWSLVIGGIPAGRHLSPENAAEFVNLQNTHHRRWDLYRGPRPASLRDWDLIRS